jgi:hypothetical protein
MHGWEVLVSSSAPQHHQVDFGRRRMAATIASANNSLSSSGGSFTSQSERSEQSFDEWLDSLKDDDEDSTEEASFDRYPPKKWVTNGRIVCSTPPFSTRRRPSSMETTASKIDNCLGTAANRGGPPSALMRYERSQSSSNTGKDLARTFLPLTSPSNLGSNIRISSPDHAGLIKSSHKRVRFPTSAVDHGEEKENYQPDIANSISADASAMQKAAFVASKTWSHAIKAADRHISSGFQALNAHSDDLIQIMAANRTDFDQKYPSEPVDDTRRHGHEKLVADRQIDCDIQGRPSVLVRENELSAEIEALRAVNQNLHCAIEKLDDLVEDQVRAVYS